MRCFSCQPVLPSSEELVSLQHFCVHDFESYLRFSRAQGRLRPFGLKLPNKPVSLSFGQAAPFHFSSEQTSRIVGIRSDEIKFDAPFPIALRTGNAGSAVVLKDGGSVIVDKLPFCGVAISSPQCS